MRHQVLLALVYTLVAALALPGSLLASDEPSPPAPSGVAQTSTAPAEPSPAAPEQVPAPAPEVAPAAAAESAGAPPEQPQAPAEPQPVAPADPQTVPAEPAAEQDLGDERKQLRPKARRVVATAAASSAVTISNFAFSPKSVTINVGDTVTWANQDDVKHSATAKNGSFDTGTFGNGQSRSHTFDTAGTFQYVCTPHPFMKGTITVSAAGGGGSGSSDSGSSSGSGADAGSGSSSGSSGSSSSGSSSSGPSTSGSGSTSGSTSVLPDTGADAAKVAILGLLMLAVGVAVQRRAHPEGR